MKPSEVFVVFNTENNSVMHVYPEEFLAQRKLNWYCTNASAPVNGTKPWSQKAAVMTLDGALGRIYHYFYYGGGD